MRRRIIIFLCALLMIISSAGIGLLWWRWYSLPDYGTTDDSSPATHNAAAEQRFFVAYQQGLPGRWTHVDRTVEGARIPMHIAYFGGGPSAELVIDSRRDGYGSRRIEWYHCQLLLLIDGHIRHNATCHETWLSQQSGRIYDLWWSFRIWLRSRW